MSAALRMAGSCWTRPCLRIECCETLVLANAFDALRLLGSPLWPIQKVRGQISMLAANAALPLPSIPIAGAGYLLPAVAGQAVFGATSQADDDDPSVRRDDHLRNLSQLAQWVGNAAADVLPEQLQGRTGWRMVCRDRLPIIGAVPDLAVSAHTSEMRLDHAWRVPRLPGLFVFAGLGSRGITWSALGAQILASSITGAPQPVEASLRDAVDPARFVSREARRSRRRAVSGAAEHSRVPLNVTGLQPSTDFDHPFAQLRVQRAGG